MPHNIVADFVLHFRYLICKNMQQKAFCCGKEMQLKTRFFSLFENGCHRFRLNQLCFVCFFFVLQISHSGSLKSLMWMACIGNCSMSPGNHLLLIVLMPYIEYSAKKNSVSTKKKKHQIPMECWRKSDRCVRWTLRTAQLISISISFSTFSVSVRSY